MDYGTLRVTTPDGQIREYPIDVPSVVVGRADGNRVVIDHVSVSRRHAQLTIESGRVLVEDLGSGTGTFVGGQRIAANTPTLVEGGQAIRFGDTEARFQISEAAAPAPVEAPAAAGGGAFAAATPISSTDREQTVSVSLASPSAPVAAGSPTTATVTVQNRGNVVDELTISVVDLPAPWVRVSRATISLVPGAKDEVTIVIQPPRASEATAGEYPFAVAVLSREHQREVRALGKIAVLPFTGFKLSVQPARGKRDFKVSVSNAGNVPASVTLHASDDEAVLDYKFEIESAELPPGEERTVPLVVTPKSKKLLGAGEARLFRVEARPSGSQPMTADAQLTTQPPLERFKWPVLALVFLLLFGGAGYGYSQKCEVGAFPKCHESKKAAAPVATPTAVAATAGPPATAGPLVLRKGGNGVIANSDPVPTNTNCLAVRKGDTPAISPDNVVGRLCTGTRVAIKDGPSNDGTYIWWVVEGNGLTGWAAEKRVDGTGVPFILVAP
jgi:hypothetical protein